MISASHRKRDSREALVRWLRDRSSGGRTSHSGTFDCRFPILDFMPFPRFSIESRQSKSPKYWPGIFFSVSASLGRDAVQIELDCNLQPISASIGAVCQKTPQEVERDSGAKSLPKNSVKNYMSDKSRFEPDRIVRRRTRRHYCGLASRIAPERSGRVK